MHKRERRHRFHRPIVDGDGCMRVKHEVAQANTTMHGQTGSDANTVRLFSPRLLTVRSLLRCHRHRRWGHQSCVGILVAEGDIRLESVMGAKSSTEQRSGGDNSRRRLVRSRAQVGSEQCRHATRALTQVRHVVGMDAPVGTRMWCAARRRPPDPARWFVAGVASCWSHVVASVSARSNHPRRRAASNRSRVRGTTIRSIA